MFICYYREFSGGVNTPGKNIYFAKIEALSKSTDLTLTDDSFCGTPTGGADILLDYAIGKTNAVVFGISANVIMAKTENGGIATAVGATENKTFCNIDYVA